MRFETHGDQLNWKTRNVHLCDVMFRAWNLCTYSWSRCASSPTTRLPWAPSELAFVDRHCCWRRVVDLCR